MKEWERTLLDKAREIVDHGWGKLEFTTQKRDDKVSILISGGKTERITN